MNNYLNLISRDVRKILNSGLFGWILRKILLFPGYVLIACGILYLIGGSISNASVGKQAFTFFFLGGLVLFFQSKYWKSYRTKMFAAATDPESRIDDVDGRARVFETVDRSQRESTGTDSEPEQKKESFGHRIRKFLDPMYAMADRLGLNPNEAKFLSLLAENWYYVASQSSLAIQLAPEQYQSFIARYEARSIFQGNKGFEDSTHNQNLMAPSIPIAITQIPSGIRLEVELAPGLYFGREGQASFAGNGGIDQNRLSTNIGHFLEDNGLPFESVKALKKPASVNVYIDILFANPLSEIVEPRLPEPGTINCKTPIFLGQTVEGREIMYDIFNSVHQISQGGPGSGKSAAAFNKIMQVSAMSDVQIWGIDPESVLFNPFRESMHSMFQVQGTSDKALERYVILVEGCIEIMDKRTQSFEARDLSKMSVFSPTDPLIYFVIDEFAAIGAAFKNYSGDMGKPADLEKRFFRGLGMLISRGRKAGIRLDIYLQRAETKFIDGTDRSNTSTRTTFKVMDNMSVSLLHGTKIDAVPMANFTPGMCFFESDDVPLTIMRTPLYIKTPDAQDLADMEAGEDVDLVYRGYLQIVRRNARHCFPIYEQE